MWVAAVLAVALIVLSGAPAGADDLSAITPPRLSYVDGPVSFWRPGAEQWAPAQVNTALTPGDQLRTAHQGTVELQVGSRAFVRAWGDTQLTVSDQANDSLQLKVADGHLVVDLRALDPGGIVHLETPGAFFTLDRAGYYRLDVGPQAISLITRRDGQARTTRVEGGVTRTIAAPALDAWDRWNQARTDELLHSASARYVGDAVYGVRDLDEYGDWRVLPTYGAVWVPRGAPAGWAPYTTGRWVWDPRFGWTWVDSAVWGWAPFHHGRWVYLDGVWAWAPGPVVARPMYAPALVAFFHAPGVRVSVGTPFVSWVALGWGEPVVPWWGRGAFVGRPAWIGWGGPRVVNNVVVGRTASVEATDIRVYRNANVNRAVVAVAPERFGRARVEDARVTAIDARRLKPVRGALQVTPDSAERTESPVHAPRTPDVAHPRPADAARPTPPARTPRTDSTPRTSERVIAPRRDPVPANAPRVDVKPDADSARRAAATPSRPELPPRAERARSERKDSAPAAVPRRPEKDDRRDERRAPTASAPSVRGAAAHERQERGQTLSKERRDARSDDARRGPRATPSVAH